MFAAVVPGGRIGLRVARRACVAVVAVLALSGCVSMYVDNSLGDVPPSAYQHPATPQSVQVLFSFQTKGATNAKGTEMLKAEALDAVSASGLFESVSEGPVASGALLSITLNNVPITSQGEAVTKGVVTGLTFGLAGSEVADGYVCTVEYVSGPGAAKLTKVVNHAIYSTIGAKGAPAGATKAKSVDAAVKTVARQAIQNALKDLSHDPAFQS